MDSQSITKNVILNNGVSMPIFGLGTSQLPNVDNIVYESIKLGIRMIDTAMLYNNEVKVGLGINKAISEGIVKREDLFIITKIWYTHKHVPEEALKSQLKNLNLTYVDLYLDHFPFSINEVEGKVIKTPTHVLWKNMEDLVKKGLTKSIGVSNYNAQLILDILSYCEIKPVVNEVEFHPYFYQSDLLEFCKNQDIVVIAYCSMCKANYIDLLHNKSVNLDLLSEKVIIDLGLKYNKTPGQIALNWALAQGVSVIPMSSKVNRIAENIGSLDFTLSNEDIKEISCLNKSHRTLPSTMLDLVIPNTKHLNIYA